MNGLNCSSSSHLAVGVIFKLKEVQERLGHLPVHKVNHDNLAI